MQNLPSAWSRNRTVSKTSSPFHASLLPHGGQYGSAPATITLINKTLLFSNAKSAGKLTAVPAPVSTIAFAQPAVKRGVAATISSASVPLWRRRRRKPSRLRFIPHSANLSSINASTLSITAIASNVFLKIWRLIGAIFAIVSAILPMSAVLIALGYTTLPVRARTDGNKWRCSLKARVPIATATLLYVCLVFAMPAPTLPKTPVKQKKCLLFRQKQVQVKSQL